jgi:hypothetical protein
LLPKFRGIAEMYRQLAERHRQGVANNRTPAHFAVAETVAQLGALLATPSAEDGLLNIGETTGLDRAVLIDRLAHVVADDIRPAIAEYRDVLLSKFGLVSSGTAAGSGGGAGFGNADTSSGGGIGFGGGSAAICVSSGWSAERPAGVADRSGSTFVSPLSSEASRPGGGGFSACAGGGAGAGAGAGAGGSSTTSCTGMGAAISAGALFQ